MRFAFCLIGLFIFTYSAVFADEVAVPNTLINSTVTAADNVKFALPSSLSRVAFNDQELFLNGINLAWSSFSNDIGPNVSTPNLAHFENVFAQMQANGGNVMRLWLHTNGQYTPEWNGDMVISPGVDTISDLKAILDLAWKYDIGLIPCLWAHSMLKISNGSTITDRSRAILTQPENRQSYIDNSLIPMVEALKGHPAIVAWEIFNEAEGMSELTDWAETYHIPISDIQAFVNVTAGAIHRTDPDAQVTTGTLDFFYITDVEEGTYNLYTDQRLIEAGGDVDGTLDFYTVHYYGWGPSPFEHPASYWGLDKPLVIAEFWADCEYCGDLPAQSIYSHLYDNGYAGALSWSWTDRNNQLMLSQLDGLFNLHPQDVLIERPGRPVVNLTLPADQSFQDYGVAVQLSADASDPDGSIVRVEFYIDGVKYGQDVSTPYEMDFTTDELGSSFSVFAVAVDNDGIRGRSVSHSFTVKQLVEPGRLEAEDASYETVTRGEDPSASLGAYLDMRSDGSITWLVPGVPSAGDYAMTIGFNLVWEAPKTNSFSINGDNPINVVFDGITNSWRKKIIQVPLLEGDNTIVLTPSWGWMNFDYIAFPFIEGPDTTPPEAPSVTGVSPTADTTPTWSWSSGGGGNANYRYKLDDSDLSTGATETMSTTYSPSSHLADATYTLYVQEQDDAENWSTSGSFAITIDALNDTDGDGMVDTEDDFVSNAAASIDTDSDGKPDSFNEGCNATCVADSDLVLDLDDDGDGVLDADDAFPLISIGNYVDTDNDGAPDECDADCLALGMTADTDVNEDIIKSGLNIPLLKAVLDAQSAVQ
jgi:hypothetical protein